jgi:hypothetical protein
MRIFMIQISNEDLTDQIVDYYTLPEEDTQEE